MSTTSYPTLPEEGTTLEQLEQHDRDCEDLMARQLSGKDTEEIEDLVRLAESGEHGPQVPMARAMSVVGRRILEERQFDKGPRLAPDSAGLPIKIRAFACQKCAGPRDAEDLYWDFDQDAWLCTPECHGDYPQLHRSHESLAEYLRRHPEAIPPAPLCLLCDTGMQALHVKHRHEPLFRCPECGWTCDTIQARRLATTETT